MRKIIFKIAVVALVGLAPVLAHAQSSGSNPTFEERVNQVNPNESINFENPTFSGLPLMALTPYRASYAESLETIGNQYCLFLNYKGLLSIADEDFNGKKMNVLRNNSLLVEEVKSISDYDWKGNARTTYPTRIKSLRCKL